MLKPDFKDLEAIGLTIAGSALSVILGNRILASIIFLIGVAIIGIAHFGGTEQGDHSSNTLLDFAGNPIRMNRSPRPWIVKAVLVAMGVFLLIGIGWRLHFRKAYSPQERTKPIQLPPATPPNTPPASTGEPKTPDSSHKSERKQPVTEPCKITASATTLIVARVYFRGMMPKPPQTEAIIDPNSQELFYEWVLTLSPNQSAGGVTLSLKDEQKPTYRLKIDPDEAVISDVVPGWMSGFAEPREPDYYKRTIKLERLSKTTTITIRRPMKFRRGTENFDASTFPISGYEVNSTTGCDVEESNLYDDPQTRFLHLMLQFKRLIEWKYGKERKPAKILLDPDEPPPSLQPGEAESTVEVRCTNDACSEILAHDLEARVKRTEAK